MTFFLKAGLFSIACVLLSTALAEQKDAPRSNGVIFGRVTGQDGQPAKDIGLAAQPLGVPLGAVLPSTRTNDSGAYRFENLPWWGTYTVYADDEKAGYSPFSTNPGHLRQVEITPKHRVAELDFQLPRKAGFLAIHLTNRRSGNIIPAMQVTVMEMGAPDTMLFVESCASTQAILVPPDKNLIIHVRADGFREWDESVGRGQPLNVPSGSRMKLDVQLDPATE